jgi:protein-L-isoaspartate(D-aspartate) O-methyltransferase
MTRATSPAPFSARVWCRAAARVRRSATALGALLHALSSAAQPPYAAERARLVADVESDVARTSATTGRERLASDVLRAIGEVPRHEFVPAALRANAYLNRPLPIGDGQTISQPFIVALMTDLAGLRQDSVVLEVGTGSGYQAAVLAEIARDVYSIEIIASLGERAAATLERLGYDNVHLRIGDGYAGWPEAAPFDAIIVTAAPEAVPEPLIAQLKAGGRLVIPLGSDGAPQHLRVLEKRAAGDVVTTDVLPVSFVPFTRDER